MTQKPVLKLFLSLLFLLWWVSCTDSTDENSLSLRGDIRVRVVAVQNSGVDSLTIALRAVSGSALADSQTLAVTDLYINAELDFAGLPSGLYRLEISSTGDNPASQISEVEVEPGGFHSARMHIGSGGALTVEWLTAAGLVPGISLAPQGFDAAYYKGSADYDSPANMVMCAAAGSLQSMQSCYLRYPDGLVLRASDTHRAPHLTGLISAGDNFIQTQRYRYSGSGDYLLWAEDFNGAALTVSDYMEEGWNEIFLEASSAAGTGYVSWTFVNGAPPVGNYCVFVFGPDGYGFRESAVLDSGISEYTASFTGNALAAVLALDRPVDSLYAQQVIENTEELYYRFDELLFTFAVLNVASDTPRDYGIIYYDTVIIE